MSTVAVNAPVETTGNTSQRADKLVYLDPSKVRRAVFGNPRQTTNPEKREELKQSITAAGYVHTPIWARPILGISEDDEVEIIAGNTRLDIALEIPLPLIPVLIKYGLTDTEAYELAVSENTDRVQMSLIDEAQGLKTIVTNCGGDIAAACSRMGWPESKFRKALQLLKATKKVLSLVGVKNLNGFTLTEGHAALLALITPTLQDRLVDSVIHEKLSVGQLNNSLKSKIKQPINKAVFCTKECSECEYNSSQQTALLPALGFDNDLCTNPLCYQTKTNTHFEEQQKVMTEEYGKVVLKSAIQGSMTVNEAMVGKEQFSACKGCDKLCAVLNDKTEMGQGQIVENQCIKVSCFKEKTQAHMLASSKKTTQEPEVESSGDGNAADKSKTKGSGKATSKGKATVDAPIQAPKRCIVTAQKAVREIAGQQLIENHPSYTLAITVASLHSALGKGSIERCLEPLITQSLRKLEKLHQEAITELTFAFQSPHHLNMERIVIQSGKKLVSDLPALVKTNWEPTSENLTEMTKQLRLLVLDESGFAAAFKDKHSEKEYYSLTNENTDVQVAKILKFQFDWENYAPSFHVNAIDNQTYS
ncbi:ParB N-terminal domain-containing protein [Vibrio sp. Y2-5]|uniref:ParB/RepB/Spo0J family partition protein n=1 Tax=Vibrio sp. Y2-5 TaxID=2743977 RepID=UPI001660334F|nr:ParB/RepB/Spo0J family partition protein [Vibrio sp. Y2-5]MBD0788222.1 ParB N-terminal domain-containing protein [Vibrio sp. Y2-5]